MWLETDHRTYGLIVSSSPQPQRDKADGIFGWHGCLVRRIGAKILRAITLILVALLLSPSLTGAQDCADYGESPEILGGWIHQAEAEASLSQVTMRTSLRALSVCT
jgi:hypothetical protein